MTIHPDIQTALLLARRARYFSTAFWLLAAVLGMALLAAEFSGRQPATVALDVGLSAMRLFLPLLIVLLVQELLLREFDRRYFLTSLTYPRSRHWLLLGRVATILLLIYGLMLVMGLALGLTVTHIASSYDHATPPDLGSNYALTLLFVALDLFVLTAVASFLAIAASTPSFVLIGTFGFMLVSRSYSGIIALLERNQFIVDNTELYQRSLGVLFYIFPDLGALDIRMISLYNKIELLPSDWLTNIIATTAYGSALMLLGLLFLHRKRFN